jgi:hypothetical protein
MSNEVYNMLTATGPSGAVQRFRDDPFPKGVAVFGFEDFQETRDPFGFNFYSH